jgi:IS1 family transposase
MNVLRKDKKIQVLRMLAEGSSLRSVSRLTGVHRDTCAGVVTDFGGYCQTFLRREMRDLPLKHIEVDEMWTYVRKKQHHVTGEEPDADKIGTYYIFIAFDETTRLIPTFRVGRRDAMNTLHFITDLKRTLWKPKRVFDGMYSDPRQPKITRISSDGWEPYPECIDFAFRRDEVDYGTVVKNKQSKDGMFIVRTPKFGEIPNKSRITTSLVERNNLTIRTFMKRLNRRTICYSKKLENLQAAMAMHIVYYNYCWNHSGIGTSPAHRAGIAPKRFSFAEFHDIVRQTTLYKWGD